MTAFTKAIGGTLTPHGATARRITRTVGGVLAPRGVAARRTARTLLGVFGFVGGLAGLTTFGVLRAFSNEQANTLVGVTTYAAYFTASVSCVH